ncbi:MAG TPA: toll/interleukin-1 receptor domain-containing protein [Isosphaeraceae bacterium]|jgi:hypothetical protein|nr:toll/interleukin-1 receptor domain-containing protein [Isosphaeraceae bacterium]
MARDVFISYSKHNQAIADAVCHHLEAAGVRCWIAPRDIPPGGAWASWIIEAIRQSRILVVVFSSHANASRQVMREVERAVHYGVAILPFRVEDVTPQGDLEYYLSAVHWLDAMSPPLERHIESLVIHVRGELAAQQAASEGAAERNPAVERGNADRMASTSAIRPPRPLTMASISRFWKSLDQPRVGAMALLALMPLSADFVLHLHVAPPWPDRLAVDFVTGLANVLAFSLIWFLVGTSKASRLRWMLIWATVATCLLFVVFLILRAAFVWDTTSAHYQEVGGFILNKNARRLQAADPSQTIKEMFHGYEYDPTNIWEPWTLVVARVSLLIAWFGFSTTMAVVVSLLLKLVRTMEQEAQQAPTAAP